VAERPQPQKIERFEDLIAWQKARHLATQVYKVAGSGRFSKGLGLRGQIQRASVSIVSNIAEGFERGGRREFHPFLVLAKASCAELRSQLYVAFDVGHLPAQEFSRLHALAEEVGRIIGGLRVAVGQQRCSCDDQEADRLPIRKGLANAARHSVRQIGTIIDRESVLDASYRIRAGECQAAGRARQRDSVLSTRSSSFHCSPCLFAGRLPPPRQLRCHPSSGRRGVLLLPAFHEAGWRASAGAVWGPTQCSVPSPQSSALSPQP